MDMNFTVPGSLPYPLLNQEESPDAALRSIQGSALAQFGFTLLREDRLAEAVEAFSEALSLEPNSNSIREWRAVCYIQLGLDDKALADAERVVILNAKSASAYNNRALCHLVMGRTTEALEDLNTTISLNPGHVSAYANRARIYYSLGQYALAQQSCDAGLLLDESNEELLSAQRNVLGRLHSLEPEVREQPEQ